MKTCEACKGLGVCECVTCVGTGQIEESIKPGDIVENRQGALGIVVADDINRCLDKAYSRDRVRYILLSRGLSRWGSVGASYTTDAKMLTVRHGHISIEAGMRLAE